MKAKVTLRVFVCVCVSYLLSYVRLTHEAPLSMDFSKQEYWSQLPFPSPGDLSNPEIEPGSPTWQADSLLSEPPGKPQVTLYS